MRMVDARRRDTGTTYGFVTVGAAAAHRQGFKRGGLKTLLEAYAVSAAKAGAFDGQGPEAGWNGAKGGEGGGGLNKRLTPRPHVRVVSALRRRYVGVVPSSTGPGGVGDEASAESPKSSSASSLSLMMRSVFGTDCCWARVPFVRAGLIVVGAGRAAFLQASARSVQRHSGRHPPRRAWRRSPPSGRVPPPST